MQVRCASWLNLRVGLWLDARAGCSPPTVAVTMGKTNHNSVLLE